MPARAGAGSGTGHALLVVLVMLVLADSGPGRAVQARPQRPYQSKKLQAFNRIYDRLRSASTDDVLPGRFLVKLRPKSVEPVVAARSGGDGQSRAQEIIGKMRAKKMLVRIVREYTENWQGFSLQTDDIVGTLEALDLDNEVLSIYPVVWIRAPDVTSVQNVSALSSAYYVANSSALTTTANLADGGLKRLDGTGVKVAIIDTGVDYTHPALGGTFGNNSKVAFGYDFVGDNLKGNGVPVPDRDPMDCIGHGTHVAGIIAGSYYSNVTGFRFQGIAPGATLGAYKVFGCQGGTTNDLIVAAMAMAARDGMQIINLSIGDEGAWGGAVADCIKTMTDQGIIVVTAAGNAGSSGPFMTSAAGSAPSAIAVGSVQSYAAPAALEMRVSSGSENNTFTVLGGFGDVVRLVDAVVLPSVAALDAGSLSRNASEGCGSNARLGNMTGAVALLPAGGCADKIRNAVAAGAVGVILYGDDADVTNDVLLAPLTGSYGRWSNASSPFPVPVFMVDTASAGSIFATSYAALRPPSPPPSPSPPPARSPPPPSPPPPPPPSPPPSRPPSPRPPSPRPPTPRVTSAASGRSAETAGPDSPSSPVEPRSPAVQADSDSTPASGKGPGSGRRLLAKLRGSRAAAEQRQLNEQQQQSQSQSQRPVTQVTLTPATILGFSGSLVSPYSSWGPSPDLRIKPTVTAPGGAILSSWSVNASKTASFAYLSGTSQAAPYVSGALAIGLDAGRAWNVTAVQLEAAMVTTAQPVATLGDRATPVNVMRAGAGVIDLNAMVTNMLDVSPSRIELGSALTYGQTVSYNLDITSRSTAALNLTLTYMGAMSIDVETLMTVDVPDVRGTNSLINASSCSPDESAVSPTVIYNSMRVPSMTNLLIPERGRMRIRVNFTLPSPSGPNKKLFFSGYLALKPATDDSDNSTASANQPPIYIPYLGYTASLMELPVLYRPLPGGVLTPNASWWWDVNGKYWQNNSRTPPPSPSPPPPAYFPPPDGDYGDHDYQDVPQPEQPMFIYPRASWPTVALFMQRQPIKQEMILYTTAYGVIKLGTITLPQSLRRPEDGAPLLITWRGAYYDVNQKRDSIVGPGDYFLLMRMTHGGAVNNDTNFDSSKTVDEWRTPAFRLSRT